MGKKYSINSAGRIVAERDIYSLGGLIVKGSIGGSVKDETQLSQSGECWLNAGDISNRPDIVIKDNAYIGTFTPGVNPVHTDGVTEFSGNTLIPGNISVRSFVADTKNNVFVKDSFIGVSMDVLCGPSTTASAFPFEQGDFKKEVAKGTLFTSASMRLDDVSACRNTATLRLGRNTYLYIPTGYRARVFWAYYDTSNQIAYSGESTAVLAGLTKLNHSVYKLAMVSVVKNDGTAMTPANLLATGAKILGHISGSLLQDFRPESVSGEYVMVNSSLIAETDNFGLATTQLRFLAGGMYNTNMYTLTNRQDYKPYGTFRNVERLEYIQYFADIHRGNANRDHYIVASDSPLVRINDSFVLGDLVNAGGVTLRNCIVPKGVFQNDVINGNTYEDIDFSYTNEFMGNTVGNRVFVASRRQGLYSLYAGSGNHLGLASYPNNVKAATSITERHDYVPLDGDIIEQGSYLIQFDKYYEDAKSLVADRVRTGRPLPTYGSMLPSLPSGFKVTSIVYLRNDFKIQTSKTDPTDIDLANPYFVINMGKTDNSPITASELIALNASLRISDYTKVPEITGSAYVGAGCTVRGDVQLHGDPYVNRIFDVNEWDRGGLNTAPGLTWDVMKDGRNSDVRMTTKSIYPVNPGDTISVSGAYRILLCWFNSDQKLMSDTGWNDGTLTVPANVYYIGIALSTKPDLKFLDFSDIPLANVKYLRAFKERRYITNELDRRSPEDILIGPDYWEQGTAGGGQADAGKTYEELKAASGTTIRLKRPINVSPSSSISSASGFSRYIRVLDTGTKFLLGESLTSAKMALLAAIIQKDPSAAITPSEIGNSRLVLEFVPQPKIIVPYGSNTLTIAGMKIRMYDNAVLSRNFNQEGSITLQGDAVMGYDFDSGACLCSNGHDDAIIKLP